MRMDKRQNLSVTVFRCEETLIKELNRKTDIFRKYFVLKVENNVPKICFRLVLCGSSV